jgi:hypothetical protein
MSATANSAVAVLSREAVLPAPNQAGLRLFAARLATSLKRFLDGLPERHGDIDLEVLKRVPAPM